MSYQELLCNNIKSLRLTKNMTQAKFAEAIGLSVEAIRNIEHKKYTPSANTIDKICETFNIKVVELLLNEPTAENTELIQRLNNKIATFTTEELLRLNDIADIIGKSYYIANK